jgi:hypothetical protein
VDANGVLRFVLKDGTEIHRIEPPEILDYQTNVPATRLVDPDGTVRLVLRGAEIDRVEGPEVLDYKTGLPATRVVDADGTVRFVLEDGSELTAYTLAPERSSPLNS